MIQYNIQYDLNNGQGWIVFKSADPGIVSAEYNRGTIQGNWDGETLKGEFIDTVSKGQGLIEFQFNENGFNAKWKAGLDEGPMKGKWIGELISTDNNNSTVKGHKLTHFQDLAGEFQVLVFNFDNVDEAIDQGGEERFKIVFDIENQLLKPAYMHSNIVESDRIAYYTGSSHVDIYGDYLSNEVGEYPGYILITDYDNEGYANWEIPFHGILEDVTYGNLEKDKYDLLKSTLTPTKVYNFLNDVFSIIKHS